MKPDAVSPNQSKTGAQRIGSMFLKPWWNGLLLIVSIAWLVVLNWVLIADGGEEATLGFASIVPIFAYLIFVLSRDAKLKRK